MDWQSPQNIPSKQFLCGHCGNRVASSHGYRSTDGSNSVHICPHCTKPTYFPPGGQLPGVAPGNEVSHLPKDIEALYREARNSVAAGCYTAAILACRKLLMNIAVAQNAKPGDSFVSYVEYLAAQGYVPPNGKGWVDHIRKKGNEATHEIVLMSQADAQELISFAEMLLKFIYEFPNKVPQQQ